MKGTGLRRAQRRRPPRRQRPAADEHGHIAADGLLRRVHGHRRGVRRDQGGARRLLPDRGGRPGRGDRHGQAGPGAVRRGRGPADQGLRLSQTRRHDGRRPSRPRSPTRTVASGPSCSPRRCASTGDIDLAEECVQDAYARALATLVHQRHPGQARRLADHRGPAPGHRRARRRDSTHDRALPLLVERVAAPDPGDRATPDIADDRLRLIFTCCHPALATDAQVALTLRLVCGLTTAEVGRAFLVSEATMAARITRAKKKIAAARIPYRVPPVEELPARIDAVLTVVHLLFTTGHTAPAGSRSGPPRPGRSGPSTWPACCGRCCPTTPTSPACWP